MSESKSRFLEFETDNYFGNIYVEINKLFHHGIDCFINIYLLCVKLQGWFSCFCGKGSFDAFYQLSLILGVAKSLDELTFFPKSSITSSVAEAISLTLLDL